MTENNKNKLIELYFHIPFCVRKCLYCDFLSSPVSRQVREQYMNALIRETYERAEECRGYSVSSLFLGGGTPSVAETEQLEALLRTVRRQYEITDDIESSIEVNPGTVDEEKLKRYRNAGINRVSIGLQSADDNELAALGRVHTWQQFLEAYRSAVAAGFENINVDVMSGLPGQSEESFYRTLQKVTALKPAPVHISAYSLILEEGTTFYRMQEEGKLLLPDEETDRRMYKGAGRFLEQNGYRRYEISNYAREGFACKHNIGYWRRQDYLGFGIGAASLINNMRFKNSEDMKCYLADPLGCRQDFNLLNLNEQMEEYMFLGLRMTAGVSPAEFEKCFGNSMETIYGDVIKRNIKDGLLKWKETGTSCKAGRRLVLTEFGLDVSNRVMADFLLT